MYDKKTMGKKLLITGAGGFVGGNIIYQARKDFDIHGIELNHATCQNQSCNWHCIDLLDSKALRSQYHQIRPDVVVHTAAISDIDYCEAHQEQAERVNVGVTTVLVSLCRETGRRMIYLSSDSVFDGKKGNYTEIDEPLPVNFYARTKVEAEKIIKSGLQNYVIIRPSLIMGLPMYRTGNSFLWRMMNSLKNGQEVAFSKEEIRTPLDVITFSRAILELTELDFQGYLHLSGNDKLTRFEMARQIVKKLGYDMDLVVDQKSMIETGRARRPLDVSLNNQKARGLLNTSMQGLLSGLGAVRK